MHGSDSAESLGGLNCPGVWGGGVCEMKAIHGVKKMVNYFSLKFPENGGRFTECHLQTTETIVCPKRWFQYVISACFLCYSDLFIVFSSGLASPVVYKCAQLQVKRAKWTIWGMISVKDLPRCALTRAALCRPGILPCQPLTGFTSHHV